MGVEMGKTIPASHGSKMGKKRLRSGSGLRGSIRSGAVHPLRAAGGLHQRHGRGLGASEPPGKDAEGRGRGQLGRWADEFTSPKKGALEIPGNGGGFVCAFCGGLFVLSIFSGFCVKVSGSTCLTRGAY